MGKRENAGYQQFLFSKVVLSGCFKNSLLTHPLIHHFETVQNSKKLQTTTEIWLLKDFKRQIV